MVFSALTDVNTHCKITAYVSDNKLIFLSYYLSYTLGVCVM